MTDVDRLVSDHLGLARNLARAFSRNLPSMHADEFESAAMMALWNAAKCYDPDRGVTFLTHATGRIWCRLVDCYRAAFGTRDRKPKLPTVPLLDEYDVAAASDPTPAFEWDEAFEALIHPLSFRQREAMRLIYRDGLERKEAGERLGCTGNYVSQLHGAAMAQLRGTT